jgi:hypothetical protein
LNDRRIVGAKDHWPSLTVLADDQVFKGSGPRLKLDVPFARYACGVGGDGY